MLDNMRDVIRAELDAVEREHGVRVLLAVESGSRAWGFASPDSDYDVRLIYMHEPRHYLALQDQRDVIEWKLDEVLDINGWDLNKALRLMRASNPTLLEWMNSPMVYMSTPEASRLQRLSDQAFRSRACAFHYLSMARKLVERHFQDECVPPKKYLYVMRSLLAARWVLDRNEPAPVLFDELCQALLPAALSDALAGLLAKKAVMDEGETIGHLPILDEWMNAEYALLHQRAQTMAELPKLEWSEFNELFFSLLGVGR